MEDNQEEKEEEEEEEQRRGNAAIVYTSKLFAAIIAGTAMTVTLLNCQYNCMLWPEVSNPAGQQDIMQLLASVLVTTGIYHCTSCGWSTTFLRAVSSRGAMTANLDSVALWEGRRYFVREDARKEEWKKGEREGGREGGTKVGRNGGREGRRDGGREGRREGGREIAQR